MSDILGFVSIEAKSRDVGSSSFISLSAASLTGASTYVRPAIFNTGASGFFYIILIFCGLLLFTKSKRADNLCLVY